MAAVKRGARHAGKELYIGTSGWMYKDWGAAFYPKGMKKGFLTYLSNEFNTVEINSSFYHLPRASTFEKWRGETPENFVFATKMSRYITHQQRLSQTRGSLARFLKPAKGLEEKLGVILIQLPPSLKYDQKTLEKFLADLKAVSTRLKMKPRFALEPRHQSWMEEENAKVVRHLLKKQNIALVFPHSAKIPSFEPTDENILADFVYLRFHGPSEFAASRYGKKLLAPHAKRISKWLKSGLTVYVYFNNDINGHAIDDARDLRELCGVKSHSAGLGIKQKNPPEAVTLSLLDAR